LVPDRKVLAERIAHERELRTAERAAFEHERELRTLYDQHERELRTANEAAVDKARAAHDEVIEVRLQNLNHFAERMEQLQQTYLPTARFDRDHASLIERYEREYHALSERHNRDIEVLTRRVSEQEQVTVRQDSASETTKELLDLTRTSTEALNTNRRWLIGLAIATAISLAGLALTLFSLLEHQGTI
jgi:hypothetical protein